MGINDMFVTLEPEKNSCLNCIFSGFIFTTAQVVCTIAMINPIWYLSPEFKYIELSYIHLYSLPSMDKLQIHNMISSQLA